MAVPGWPGQGDLPVAKAAELDDALWNPRRFNGPLPAQWEQRLAAEPPAGGFRPWWGQRQMFYLDPNTNLWTDGVVWSASPGM